MLETARLLGQFKPKTDYCIELVAYCLEEPPFFGSEKMGSYIHAKSLNDNGIDVIGMICFEMIGYFSDRPNSQPFPAPELSKTYPSTANFIIVVGIKPYEFFNNHVKTLMAENSKIDVRVISIPTGDSLSGLASLSDQRNYWHFGYPALMINDTSFVRNPNYHCITDTIETLDFEKMTEVVNGAYNAIIKII